MSELIELKVFITTAGIFPDGDDEPIFGRIHEPNRNPNADSDGSFNLVYVSKNGKRQEFRFPNQPYDQWETARTDFYTFLLTNGGDELEEIEDKQFKIVALGDDAWLPESIFILGRSKGGFRVLVAREQWPEEAWFSTQLSDANGRAEKARLLDSKGTPTTP